jgi:hypothetical protein
MSVLLSVVVARTKQLAVDAVVDQTAQPNIREHQAKDTLEELTQEHPVVGAEPAPLAVMEVVPQQVMEVMVYNLQSQGRPHIMVVVAARGKTVKQLELEPVVWAVGVMVAHGIQTAAVVQTAAVGVVVVEVLAAAAEME